MTTKTLVLLLAAAAAALPLKGPSPADHLAAPPTRAAALFVELAGAGHWVGVSWRGGAEGAYDAGSVAFYYNGPEDEPAVDFVRLVAEGREGELSERLIELRWKGGRSVGRALLERLGFTEEEGGKLAPAAQSPNSLYF